MDDADGIPSWVPRPQTSRTSVRFYWRCERRRICLGVFLAVVAIAAACVTSDEAYLVIGGSVLTIAGIPWTFLRLMRRGAAGVDDPMPPPTVAPPPEVARGGRGVLLNPHWMEAKRDRLAENFSVITGVGFLILGTFLAGVAAPIMQLLRAAAG